MASFFSASDIVGTAIEIERRGRNVYIKAAAAAKNPDVKSFLDKNRMSRDFTYWRL